MVGAGFGTPHEDVAVAWAPLPGSQELFLSCPIREALYEGTRGPGKTEALLMSYAQHVGCGYGDYWRGIIFRQTYKQLSDLIVKSQRLFYNIFPGARYNKSDHTWIFPDGEQLLLRQIRTPDDYWDYHGHEYPFIGFEELTSWPDLQCYDAMQSCLRCSKVGVPRLLRSTTNPFGIGHRAVKERFITPAPRGHVIVDEYGNERVAIHGSIYENAYLLKADPLYVRRLEAIRDINVKRAWLYGSWDINAGGAIDDLWREGVHMLPVFDVPLHWPVYRSFDWGSARPFSLGYHAKSDGCEVRMRDGSSRYFAPGTFIRVAELYGTSSPGSNEGLRWTNRKIAKEGLQFERENPELRGRTIKAGAADAAIFSKATGYEKSVYEEMESEGMEFEAAPKGPGSRRKRLELLRSRLEASLSNPMEAPGLFALDTCREFRRQLPTLPRDQKDYEVVDTDAEDHLYDELTYQLTIEANVTAGVSVALN